jgi:hypothetical protein
MKTYLLTIVVFISLFLSPLRSFSQITDAEINGIISLREEEKVAYDVYMYLYEKYDNLVFKNIAQNEKDHMIKMKELINTYNLNDPLSGTEDSRGVFTNKKMQGLYDEMIMGGNYGVVDAMRASARFEETDIQDLRNNIAISSDPTILAVYQILEASSQDHLRALVKYIKEEGISYKPSVLSKEEYDKIMATKSNNDLTK